MAVNPNDMTAFRKKRKQRALIYKILAITLLTFGILFIWFNAETIFEPLRGIASRITTKTSDDVGFPVQLPGSAGYSLERFGTNFSLLTDTYLYTYTKQGGQVYAFQHGYSNAFQKTTDRRILIYNHDGHEFSLYNKTSRLYEIKTDEKIIYAALGADDTAAVVTTSTLYSNILYIYDGSGKWRYTRRFGDEKVNGVAFVKGTDDIFVITANVTGGDITSHVYRLKYSSEDDEVWKYDLPPDSLALGIYETDSSVMVLCDNLLLSLSQDGTFLGSYAFNTGTLQKPVIGDSFTVLILSDYVTGTTSAVSLDNEAGLIASEGMPSDIKKVEISGNMVYTLESGVLNAYDRFLEQKGETVLGEEYNNFIIIDNEALLLGYEQVNSATLG